MATQPCLGPEVMICVITEWQEATCIHVKGYEQVREKVAVKNMPILVKNVRNPCTVFAECVLSRYFGSTPGKAHSPSSTLLHLTHAAVWFLIWAERIAGAPLRAPGLPFGATFWAHGRHF